MNAADRENDIRKRAFDHFVKRGEINGNDQDDWFKAEKEIRDKKGKKIKIKQPVNN